MPAAAGRPGELIEDQGVGRHVETGDADAMKAILAEPGVGRPSADLDRVAPALHEAAALGSVLVAMQDHVELGAQDRVNRLGLGLAQPTIGVVHQGDAQLGAAFVQLTDERAKLLLAEHQLVLAVARARQPGGAQRGHADPHAGEIDDVGAPGLVDRHAAGRAEQRRRERAPIGQPLAIAAPLVGVGEDLVDRGAQRVFVFTDGFEQ